MPDPTTLERLGGALARLLEPLAEAARLDPQPYGLRLFLETHAIDLDRLVPEDDALLVLVGRIDRHYATLEALLVDGAPPPGDAVAVLEAASAVIDTFDAFGELAFVGESELDVERLARLVLDTLVVRYLRTHQPDLLHLLHLLDIVGLPDVHRGVPARFAPERLRDWIKRLEPTAREAYGWGSPNFRSEELLRRLSPVLASLGIPTVLEEAPSLLRLALTGDAPEAVPHPSVEQLRVPLAAFVHDGVQSELGFALVPLPASVDGASDAGLALVPYGHGRAGLSREVSEATRVRFDNAAGVEVPFGLIVRPDGADVTGLDGADAPAALDMGFTVSHSRRIGTPLTLLEQPGLGALEIDSVGLRLGLRQRPGEENASVAATIGGRLRLSPPADDAFLGALLPASGLDAPFSVDVGWSGRDGLFLGAAGALEVTLPIRQSLFDAVHLESLTIGLGVDGARVPLTVAITASANLGPFRATLDRVGLEVALAFSNDGADTRPARLETRFKAPAGVVLALDSTGLSGGGYLAFDADKGEYAGLVQLKFGTLLLTGVGILNTRRPDGRPGFSLALLITGEFAPVPLGFGFTLNGVGGLLGVNRAADTDALREGVRSGALGALLFPERALENAPRIVSDLGRFFPPSSGTHLFGPMIRIGWGPVPILSAEIGIVLEFPDPLRMLLLGRLRLGLPSLDKAIARINMDLFGVIDFDAGTLAIDASLVDSTIAGFRLEGDAALRARWLGDDPDFALAIGGFHPGATPPAGFPALRRVGIDLSASSSRRLRLESYFALTTNSVQCGARVDAFAKAGIFSAEAFLSFDTLFRFEPFRFAVAVRGAAVIRMRGRVVLGVELALSLSGPRPWQAAGRVRFTVAGVGASVRFDLTLGDEPDRLPVRPAALRALLLEELERPGAWSGATAPSGGTAVTLRDTRGDADATPLVHPQGRLGVRQTLVPLGERITRYGELPVPEAEQGFRIARMTLGRASPGRVPIEVPTDVLTDRFAPAQYAELSDAERLSAPAYAEYASGVSARPNLAAAGDRVSFRPDYEPVTIDTARGVRLAGGGGATLPDGALAGIDRRGPAARAVRSRRGTIAYPGPKRTLRLRTTESTMPLHRQTRATRSAKSLAGAGLQ